MKNVFTFIFIIFCFTLFSQQSDGYYADSVGIDNIVITQSKIPISLRNTAKPVQIITSEALKLSAGSDISQILNDASGIDVIGALSNATKDKSVFVRGASGEFTLILINGQPILDPSGIGGVADLRSIPLTNIKKIEVLKGSQSALYGSDALAGVINIITEDLTDEDGINAGAQVAYGSFNTSMLNADLRGKAGRLTYNIGASRESSDGLSEALSNDPNIEFEKDGMERLGLTGGIGYQISDKLRWRGFVQYTDFQADTDSGSFADSEVSEYLTDLLNFGSSLDYNSDSWQGALKYTHTNTDRNFISEFGPFPFMGRFDNVDAFGSTSLSDQIKVVLGVNYQNHKMLDETSVIPDPSENIFSPYASFLFSLGEKFNAEAGLRYNNHSRFGSNTNYSLSASHWISDDLKAFANFSTGFKAPNLFQLYGAFGANPELRPQTSKSFEIGMQAPHSNGLLNPQITFFKREAEDVIVFGTDFLYANIMEQSTQGVEIELGFELAENLALRFQYTYLDGGQQNFDFSTGSQDINRLLRRPKHNLAIKGYFNPNEKLSLNASVKSVGKRNDIFFAPDFSQSEVILDSYLYITLHGRYKLNENFSVFLDLKNLGNSDFQEIYGFTTPGMNFMFGVNWKL